MSFTTINMSTSDVLNALRDIRLGECKHAEDVDDLTCPVCRACVAIDEADALMRQNLLDIVRDDPEQTPLN